MKKSIIGILLAGIMVCSGTINVCFASTGDKENEIREEQYFSGDMNLDGKLDLTDAQIMLKGALGIIDLTEEQEFIRKDQYVRNDGYLFYNSGLESANKILKYVLNIEQPDIIIKEKPEIYYSAITDKKYGCLDIFTSKEDLINWAESHHYTEILNQAEKLSEEDFNDKSMFVFATNVYADKTEDFQLDYIMTYENRIYLKYQDNSEVLDFKNSSYLEMSFIEKKPELKYYCSNETNIVSGGEKCNYRSAGFWTNGQVEEDFTVVRSKEELEKYKEKILGMVKEDEISNEKVYLEQRFDMDEEYFKNKTLLLYQFDTDNHEKIDETDINYEITETDFKVNLEYIHITNLIRPAIYIYGPTGKIAAFELSNDWIKDKEVSIDVVFNDYIRDDEDNLQKCE